MAKARTCTDPHDKDRRRFLGRILGLAGASAAGSLVPATAAFSDEKQAEIKQPVPADKREFMNRAAEMRRIAVQSGDQAYGAIVVKNGRIVGQAPSRVIVNHDPTAHGEVEALRDAGRRLGTNDLSGCEIYTTAKPCQMCETACYWARISRIYYGSDIADGGAPRYSSCS